MNGTVLITGASSGIGYEFAKIFAKKKYNLILIARSKQKLTGLKEQLEKKFGTECRVIPVDLSNHAESSKLIELIKAENLAVDILINNAGFGDFGLFTKSNWDKELQMVNLNIVALTYLSKEIAKMMVARKSGKILNVASTASFFPGPLMAVYYATKAYILSFSVAISNELKGTGVTVTALCPGPTTSGFQSAADLGESKLVKGKKLPTSLQVAEYGYKALFNNRLIAIHGFMNKLQVFASRFTSRSLLATVVRKMSDTD